MYVIFRALGKRSLKEITRFDFVLVLIVSETTTDALIAEDYSLVMVCTLVRIDYLLSKLKDKSKWFQIVSEGAPLVIVAVGKPLKARMEKSRVDEDDVMEAARLLHGLETLDQVKYAVLERDGSISIIPKQK